MITREHELTVETFWQQYAGQPFELIDGRVIKVSPAGGESPRIGATMTIRIGLFVEQNNLGIVTNAEGGYWIGPKTLRAPDVGFYSWEKHKLHTDPNSYRPFPPDLAVEVVSPSDVGADIDEKVELYLRANVPLIWVVYPRTRTVMVFRPDERPDRLTENDILTGGDVLPGFELRVTDCFPAPPPDEHDQKDES